MTSPLDPIAEMIAGKLAELLLPQLAAMIVATRAPATEPLMMRRRDYARRVGLAVRTLDVVLPTDAYAGEGRLRRVVVAIADRALLARGASDRSGSGRPDRESVELDGPAALAVATARRAR